MKRRQPAVRPCAGLPAGAAIRNRLARTLAVGVLASLPLLAPAGGHPGPSNPSEARGASFGDTQVSLDTRRVAEWAARSGDHAGLSFLIIDKKAATLHVFDAAARLLASSPVLLGSAVGDHTPAGIGLKPIADVQPHERTTPAGRFIAERGRNAKGQDVVWVDYDAAISMHRVINDVPAERRLQRLATPTVSDNRISYGCINIPVSFYEARVRPMFAEYRAVVYILPETQPLEQVFALDRSSREADALARRSAR